MGGHHELHGYKANPVPIVLRAAETSQKRFITALPPTLDALLLKARSLFPVPPGNTPYITLDQDDQTVILEDALPFLREREVLVFRWSPDTPRKAHGKSVKWDSNVIHEGKSSGSATPSGSASRSARAGGGGGASSTIDTTSSTSSSSASTRQTALSSSASPQRQLTQAQHHRAAHARRVLEEQKRIQEEEEAEAARLKAEEVEKAEEERRVQKDAELEDRRKAEAAQREKDEQGAQRIESGVDAAQPENDAGLQEEGVQLQALEEPSPKQLQGPDNNPSSPSTGSRTPSRQFGAPAEPVTNPSILSPSDLVVSGSSPPPYSSPHKPAVEREVTPSREEDSDNARSSPLVPSPTHKVHAAVAKASMSPHGDKLIAGRSPVSIRCLQEDLENEGLESQDVVMDGAALDVGASHGGNSEPKGMDIDHPVEQDVAQMNEHIDASQTKQGSDLERRQAAEQEAEAKLRRETDVVYQTMRAVVDNLRNHPSNSAFRDPMPLDYTSFADSQEDQRGAIDFNIILTRICKREYGTSNATPTPLEAFTYDLKRLWSLVRAFYGPKSPQGECATVLERFSEVVIGEWKVRPAHIAKSFVITPTNASGAPEKRKTIVKKDNNRNGNRAPTDDRTEARKKAAALMASWNNSFGAPANANAASIASPGTRGEKRAHIGDEDVFTARPTINRPVPFQKRPTKQRRTGSEKGVDMMAFHRAIMGGKALVPTSTPVMVEAVNPVDEVVPIEERQENGGEQEFEKEMNSTTSNPPQESHDIPASLIIAAPSTEMKDMEAAPAGEQEVKETISDATITTAIEAVTRSVVDPPISASPPPPSSSFLDSSSCSPPEASVLTDSSSTTFTGAAKPSHSTSTSMIATPSRPRRRRNAARSGITESPLPLVSAPATANSTKSPRQSNTKIKKINAMATRADRAVSGAKTMLMEASESLSADVREEVTSKEDSEVVDAFESESSSRMESDGTDLTEAEAVASIPNRRRRNLGGLAAAAAAAATMAGAALISTATAAFIS